MTEISLRDYFDHRLNELRLQMVEGFRLRDEAIAKAERTMNERLSGMNEFRQAINDSNVLNVKRPEFERLDRDVQLLQQSKANLDGRISSMVVAVSAIVSIVMSGGLFVLSHFWK
jgi:hypothetical protein